MYQYKLYRPCINTVHSNQNSGSNQSRTTLTRVKSYEIPMKIGSELPTASCRSRFYVTLPRQGRTSLSTPSNVSLSFHFRLSIPVGLMGITPTGYPTSKECKLNDLFDMKRISLTLFWLIPLSGDAISTQPASKSALGLVLV